MRRAAEVYLVGAGTAGIAFVFGFTFAGSTPPGWTLDVVLAAQTAVIVAFLYLLWLESPRVNSASDSLDHRQDS
jgi:hypothetical protein